MSNMVVHRGMQTSRIGPYNIYIRQIYSIRTYRSFKLKFHIINDDTIHVLIGGISL